MGRALLKIERPKSAAAAFESYLTKFGAAGLFYGAILTLLNDAENQIKSNRRWLEAYVQDLQDYNDNLKNCEGRYEEAIDAAALRLQRAVQTCLKPATCEYLEKKITEWGYQYADDRVFERRRARANLKKLEKTEPYEYCLEEFKQPRHPDIRE